MCARVSICVCAPVDCQNRDTKAERDKKGTARTRERGGGDHVDFVATAFCNPMSVSVCVCAPVACQNLINMAGRDRRGTAGTMRRGRCGGD